MPNHKAQEAEYRGKPLSKMTKAQLIRALTEFAELHVIEMEQHKRSLDFIADVIKNKEAKGGK